MSLQQQLKITQLDAFRTEEEEKKDSIEKIIINAMKGSFALHDRTVAVQEKCVGMLADMMSMQDKMFKNMEKLNENLCLYLEFITSRK